MIRISAEQYENMNGQEYIGDSIEYKKNNYESKVISLIGIYKERNINMYLKQVLLAIRQGSKDGFITIPYDYKFSLDSYIIYLTVLSKLIESNKYELVLTDKTHIIANDYSVKSILNYEPIDIHQAIKNGATYNNIKLKRAKGQKYDQIIYNGIVVIDKIYELQPQDIIDRFNNKISKIYFKDYKLPEAYIDNNCYMIPLIGIRKV